MNKKKGVYTVSNYINYDVAYNKAIELIEQQNKIGLLIMFGINTGLRYVDLIGLTAEHICKAIENNNELILIEKKTKKRRIIYLNDEVIKAFNSFNSSGYLFVSRENKPYDISYINKRLKEYFKSSSKPNISTHSLRKTFARRYYDISTDKTDALVKLSEILNHTSVKMTRIYLGLHKQELNDIYKIINKAS